MSTVREAAFELLRAHGMTTIVGNPGSTELPMLSDFPADFRYVLALHELVAVGIADGYAQATGRPTHVNLHTAPGVGNAVGGIFNAQANKAPVVITAGQQVRPHITLEATLTNRDATYGPQPYVKWSHEPPRAQDVPGALARAIHHAMLPPRGPVFVSIPMDDWAQEADEDRVRHAVARCVSGTPGPHPDALRELAARLNAADNPVMVSGPEIDASGGWESAVKLAEAQRLPVWTMVAGGGRLGFPENHPNFRGLLPPTIAGVSETLDGHDLILVVGAAVFRYYPYVPGPLLPAGAELVLLTSDPDEAARAPMGDAILGDVALGLSALFELAGEAAREAPEPRPAPNAPLAAEGTGRLSGSEAMAALAAAWPQDGIAVVEAPSSTLALRNRLRISRPGSFYFSTSGGLGFGISAALGVQLGQPDRPVVCVLGDGSAQYGITALWTAATYNVPVTFLVLANQEYMILKWFASLEKATGVPGLDLPALDVAGVARAYGVDARTVDDAEGLVAALREDVAAAGPRLIQVPVATGQWVE
jgi:benzoylformate decarboxylase